MVISEFWLGNNSQSQQVLVKCNNIKVAFLGKRKSFPGQNDGNTTWGLVHVPFKQNQLRRSDLLDAAGHPVNQIQNSA